MWGSVGEVSRGREQDTPMCGMGFLRVPLPSPCSSRTQDLRLPRNVEGMAGGSCGVICRALANALTPYILRIAREAELSKHHLGKEDGHTEGRVFVVTQGSSLF